MRIFQGFGRGGDGPGTISVTGSASSRSSRRRLEASRALRRAERGRGRRDRGQALIELVLALPILFVIVFGIVEFAAAWQSYQRLTNVAREGARLAAIATKPQPLVDATVQSLITDAGLNLSNATISYRCNGPALCDGVGSAGTFDTVRVDYTHQWKIIGPVLNLMCLGCGANYSTITLTTQSISRNR
jgi:Flp pilus assembly protein TadG